MPVIGDMDRRHGGGYIEILFPSFKLVAVSILD